MLENPTTIIGALDMIFVIKALKRVGDHACHTMGTITKNAPLTNTSKNEVTD